MEASSDTQCHTQCDCYLLGSVTPLHFHRLPFATQALSEDATVPAQTAGGPKVRLPGAHSHCGPKCPSWFERKFPGLTVYGGEGTMSLRADRTTRKM